MRLVRLSFLPTAFVQVVLVLPGSDGVDRTMHRGAQDIGQLLELGGARFSCADVASKQVHIGSLAELGLELLQQILPVGAVAIDVLTLDGLGAAPEADVSRCTVAVQIEVLQALAVPNCAQDLVDHILLAFAAQRFQAPFFELGNIVGRGAVGVRRRILDHVNVHRSLGSETEGRRTRCNPEQDGNQGWQGAERWAAAGHGSLSEGGEQRLSFRAHGI